MVVQQQVEPQQQQVEQVVRGEVQVVDAAPARTLPRARHRRPRRRMQAMVVMRTCKNEISIQ